VVAFWNFQNSSCRAVGSAQSGADGDGNLNQFNSGSIFRASWGGDGTSDVTLVELDDPPQEAFNVFLAGWNRSPGPFATGAVGIHHPAVAEKRISISNRATEDDGGTHHKVWWRPNGIGVTEGGSSGSPVYDMQGHFIGQLTGGGSACGAPDSSMWDVYGKLSRSWDGGGTAATRVREQLNPAGGTAPMTLEGRDWNGSVVPAVVFSDGFGTDLGWVTNPNGTDTATTGRWQRGNPEGTSSGGTALQLDPCNGGTPNCLATGLTAGSSAGANDVDGGVTTIQSRTIALPPGGGGLTLSFAFYFAHLGNSSSSDFFRVRVVGPGGTSTVFQELGTASVDAAGWTTRSVSLSGFAGQTIRVLIEASDAAEGSLVEAAVDDVKITRP
jgi:hypothetical protein